MKVLAWSDEPELEAQLLAAAASLGTAVGADASGLPDDDPSTMADALAAAVRSEGIDVVLLGATKRGKETGPRLAAFLDLPYAADVQSIEAADGITVTRMVLSGNSIATYTMGGKAVVTAAPGVLGEGADKADVPKVSLSGDGGRVRVERTEGGGDSTFDLGTAEVVVGVGRGFKKPEDLKLAEELAAVFPGGAVGCSRPVAADLKWLGEEHWIGLSGHEIQPKAYIAAGVSGQIQHVAGIRRSKLIVAINTNKDAPIFNVCDYGIVGDLYKVLPELTTALKR